MKILYIHGFGSYYDPAKSKVQTLQSLGDVVGVNVDYCEGFEVSVQKVKDAAMSCDLIVGTSMGGFMASHVGAAFGILMLSSNQSHGDGLRRLTVSGWFLSLERRYGLSKERLQYLTRGTCFLATATGRPPKLTRPVLP
jgi:hypothetical protein